MNWPHWLSLAIVKLSDFIEGLPNDHSLQVLISYSLSAQTSILSGTPDFLTLLSESFESKDE